MVELSYSLHLSNDRNKSKKGRKTAKKNETNTTSFSNNAIQNYQNLSKVDKHNLRKYDKDQDLIYTILGTSSIVEDTKNTAQYEEIKTLYDEPLAFRKLEQCYRFDWHSNWHYVFYDKYEVNYTIVQREENGERINKYTLTINEIVSSQ